MLTRSILLLAGLAIAVISSPSPASAGTATLSGRAFVDVDGDGAYGPVDAPLTYGVSASAGLDYYRHVYPDANGAYFFGGVPVGETVYLALNAGGGCIDIFDYNWLGEWLLGWCAENEAPRAEVVLTPGEAAEVDLFQEIPGTFHGGLWLEGKAAPAGTRIEVYGDGRLCASGVTAHGVRGAALVSSFEIPVGPGCAGAIVRAEANGNQVYETSWHQFWLNEFQDWLYQGDAFSWTTRMDGTDILGLYGTAIDAEPGTLLTAIVGDEICGQVRVQNPTSHSVWGDLAPNFGGFGVLGADTKSGCGTERANVSFCLNGWATDGGVPWFSVIGDRHNLAPAEELCPLAVIPDANCDGEADTGDILSTILSAGEIGALPHCAERADFNCNGLTDVTDTLAVLRFVAAITDDNPAADC